MALTEADRLALSAAFAGRVVHKEYLALVWGRPADAGECRKPLGRHPTAKVKRAVLPEARGGQTRPHCLEAALERAGRALLFAGRPDIYGPHPSNPRSSGPCGTPPAGRPALCPQGRAGPGPTPDAARLAVGAAPPCGRRAFTLLLPPPEDLLETALAATRRMRRMVITGSPGSGKSALTENIAATGVPAISADALVARLYAPDGAAGRGWTV